MGVDEAMITQARKDFSSFAAQEDTVRWPFPRSRARVLARALATLPITVLWMND